VTVSGRQAKAGAGDAELVLSCIRFMTADQPNKFLRMDLVAVTVGGILLRHRLLGAAIGGQIFFLPRFGG
jgi:hypothetical protein